MPEPRRKVKARYRVVGPQRVKLLVNRAYMDDTKSLQQVTEEVEKDMFMVYFPQGHSTRMDRQELMFHKYHLRPRLVDMETGETVDFGGDPYDFMDEGGAAEVDDPGKYDVTLASELDDEDENEDEAKASRRKA